MPGSILEQWVRETLGRLLKGLGITLVLVIKKRVWFCSQMWYLVAFLTAVLRFFVIFLVLFFSNEEIK